jgi:hypothetical protein
MPRLQLRIYVDPGSAEIFVHLKRKDRGYHTIAATIDTGAEVSLFPTNLLNAVEYRLIEHGIITVEQAGIAQQAFKATEAIVTLFLEDENGTITEDFEVQVWFADTKEVLVGFKNILDQAILHIDMRDTRSGWLEIDP